MDFKRLEYFCTLVEFGSFSKAATSLHISQPPLSQRIKELEEELGVTLIHRTSRSFQVTPAGEKLYHKAQFILSYIHSMEKDFLHIGKPVSGLVRMGVCPPCNSLLLSSLPELQEKFPQLTFRVWIMDNQSLERHMQEVHLDFCLVQLPLINQNYKIVRLRSSPFCAVYGRGLCPPPGKTLVDARDFHGVPLLLSRRRDGGGSYNVLMRTFQMEGVIPHILLDTQDSRILLELLKNGLRAVTILPESEIGPDSGLETRRLNFGTLETLPVIIVLRQAYLSHAAFSVLRFLYEKYRDSDDRKDYLSLLFEED
ncbi:LysR family transcriptional regulator [uncultured Mailhella sp.]|uniref:LysR family transcriptional regulator n=1 Tax=uncultured Mailhella sp. TaxID=1981031 RepID=UPI002601A7C2|nr:LysR family transcriptional regulator [uncultured Mailhella sp.]